MNEDRIALRVSEIGKAAIAISLLINMLEDIDLTF